MVSLVTLDVGGSGAGDALSMVVGGGGGLDYYIICRGVYYVRGDWCWSYA